MNPIVTVIIPCYNQARFLSDSIGSLIAQTLEDWECVIVNDGSPDDTRTVALSLAANDPRVRYVEQENRGLAGARNTGLTYAHGHYIQFLDADDLIEPEKLRLQVEALSEANGLGLCYSDYRHCPEDNVNQTAKRDNFPPPRFTMDRPLHDIAARWETQFSIPVHSYLFDARFFREKGIRFDETLPNHEDWDCWMQIFSLDPIVKLTPGPLAIYRICNTAMCTDNQRMWHGFRKAIRKQQRIFRHDPVMRRILANKMQEMKNAYREDRPSSRLALLHYAKHIYKRLVPWPIQKFIANTSRSILRGRTPS